MRYWLKEKREKLNLTQEDVAEKAEITRAYYTMIENDKRDPSVLVAKKIGQVIGFDWTNFFGNECNEMKR